MSRVISFRTDDEVADTIDRVVDESDEDVSRALVTKRLVEDAVDARENPLWVRLGMSDRRAAQIEALRREGEDDGDVARELLAEAIEHRQGDVLDAIGASDELREAVEDEREDGESLDGAVERLLRRGAEADTEPPDLKERAGIGVALVVFGVLFAVTYEAAGPVAVALIAVACVAYLAAYPTVDAAAGRVVSAVRAARG